MIFFKTNDFILFHFRCRTDTGIRRTSRSSGRDLPVRTGGFKLQNFIKQKTQTMSHRRWRRPGHETGRGRTSSKIENNFLILQIKNELIIQKAKHKLFQKSGLHRTRTLLPDEVIMEFVLNRTLELTQARLAQTWIYGIFKKHGCSIRLIRCSQTCNRLFMIFWIYFVKWISLFRFITPSF